MHTVHRPWRHVPRAPQRSWRPAVVSLVLVLGACPDEDAPRVTTDAAAVDATAADVATPIEPSLTLKAPAEIRFDAQGVPHIRAASRTDSMYLQGWVTAHQRLLQLDSMRRQAYGTQAAVYGPAWLDDDKSKRVLGLKGLAVANLAWIEAQHPAVHADLLSYTAGINAWLDEARAGKHPRPPELDRIGTDWWPPPWAPEDTLAVGKLVVLANSFGADQEVLGVAASLLLGEAPFRDLFRFQPMMPTYAVEPAPGDESRFPKLPGKADAAPVVAQSFAARFAGLPLERRAAMGDALVELARRLAGLRGSVLGAAAGSNSYAIEGARTASGHALLCNEFHQPIVAPNRFMAVHLTVGDDPVGLFGYAVPGLPYVLGGHTGAMAFGITTSFGDVTDLYAEELNEAGDAVRFKEGWVPLQRREEIIEVKPEGGDWKSPETVSVTIDVVPHHGPIVNGLLPDDMAFLLSASGVVLSARWTGFEPNTNDAAAIAALWGARTIDEARAALNLFDGGPMNWTLADGGGDIGYSVAGPWPVRDWKLTDAPPWAPLDGGGAYEWTRVAPPSEALDDLRPPKGYHVDANGAMTAQNMDGDPLNDDRYLQHFADLGNRAWRLTEIIHARLNGGAAPTLEDASSWQADNLSVFSVELLPLLLERKEAVCAVPGDACEALTLLAGWDGQQALDSAEATVFNTWLTHVIHRILKQRLNSLVMGVVGGFLHAIGGRDVVAWVKGRAPAASVDWLDDPKTDAVETFDHHAEAALGEAITQLRERFGEEPISAWTWRRVHELRVHHIVFDDLSEGPYEMDGGPNTVNVSDYSGTEADGSVRKFPLTATSGAIFRFCVELAGDATRGFNVLAGGQGGDPGGPHWMTQMSTWLAHGSYGTLLLPAAVEAATVQRLDFPAGGGAPGGLQ
ncbi:MAG: hypothetical protein AMXMBFR64_39010 [Myxococcales bacterium]